MTKARRIKIAYIGGGSRGWAHTLMNDLALCGDLTGEVALYDIDPAMAALNRRWGRRVNESPQARSRWDYTVAASLPAALKGADFVFASIQPGPIRMMGSDLEIPARYGILHTVGDTTGPAGLVRALRAVGEYAAIARAVRKHCPKAWVVNFSNPMSVCTRTLYKVFPQIKAFGCCHEVFGTQHRLAALLKEYRGIEVDRRRIRTNVLGVNHFTWIDKAAYQGIDLIELYRRKMNEKGEVRPIAEREIPSLKYFGHRGQVGYDLFRRYGILAAAGERHIVEFLPFYLKDVRTLHRWGVALTPYSYRIGRWTDSPRQFRRRLADPSPLELHASDEETVRQVKALLGLGGFRTNVNLPNAGQHEGLPPGAVVETNAWFSENSVRPQPAGRLPMGVESWVLRAVYSQEMIVEAALRKDKHLAFGAILNDPLMTLTTDKAWKMFGQMLRATRPMLRGWDIGDAPSKTGRAV